MGSIDKKKVLIAISGSIAAYKSAFLIRLLIKSGAQVRAIMTESATHFISPLTISTLTKSDVYIDVIDENSWNNHVELGLWADLMIIAPATANTLSKMAHGICDNMVTAAYLSAKCPVFFAPAMDLDMWKHPSTQNNIALLKSYGDTYLQVGKGELASGLNGAGRMMEPEEILDNISQYFEKKKELSNKKVLITAGPTYEKLDPVRFIGNHSSGKMGLMLANECVDRGADVTLVLGPNNLEIERSAMNIVNVQSAAEMYEACLQCHEQTDICIFAAAVADYTPKQSSDQKIKKNGEGMRLELVRTVDIASSLGERKRSDQFHIGFALETNNEEANALKKVVKKNFDFIVLNSLRDQGAGFKHDTNKIKIITKEHRQIAFELKSKKEVAKDIMNEALRIINER